MRSRSRITMAVAAGGFAFLLATSAAGAAEPLAIRHEAHQVLTFVKQANATIEHDEAVQPQTTSLAQLTSDTTQIESQLESMPVPSQTKQEVATFEHTLYTLGYDAAELQPVVGTTDTGLEKTLNDQVTADESVLNADAIMAESTLNPLVIPPAPAPRVHHAKGRAVTWGNWRTSAFVLNDVHPVIAVGWKVLIGLTAISVLIMLRQLFRRTHSLTP
jgi:hypothetical protein